MCSVVLTRTFRSKLPNIFAALTLRCISSQKINENIILYPEKSDSKKLSSENKNLVVVITWVKSKVDHYEKYCSIYTENGFDVLVVRNQLVNILKTKQSREVAGNVVSFLAENEKYNKLLIHGFSAGGYLWSECLIHLKHHEKFDSISKRIKGQIWDSVTGPTEVALGLANTIFPHNQFLKNLLKNSVNAVLKITYESNAKYYFRGDKHFHEEPIIAPALIFASKIDLIGTEKKAQGIAENFKKLNIDTTLKIFDDSSHVQHFQKHPEEYMKLLMDHLRKCKLIK